MRRKIALTLAMIPLAQGQALYARAEQTNPPAQEPVKVEEATPPEEVRNQDFLVPTSQGILPGNLKEAQMIQELSAKPTPELTPHHLVGDYYSGMIFEAQDIDQAAAMASVSKLVGLCVIYGAIQAEKLKLNDLVVMDEEVTQSIGPTSKSKPEDQSTVDQLIDAILVISGNDAVAALRKRVSRSTPVFTRAMNKRY